DQYALLELYRLTSLNDDELFYLQFSQGMVDSMRLLHTRSWADASDSWNTHYARLSKVSNSPQRFRYLFSLVAIPNYNKAFQTAVQNETLRQLALVAISVRRYELQHGGQPPSSLDFLVPQFLAAIPRDYFSTNTLRYRLVDGGPLLYSVGLDGKDDQGDATPAQTGQAPGLWVGRDIIWPRAS